MFQWGSNCGSSVSLWPIPKYMVYLSFTSMVCHLSVQHIPNHDGVAHLYSCQCGQRLLHPWGSAYAYFECRFCDAVALVGLSVEFHWPSSVYQLHNNLSNITSCLSSTDPIGTFPNLKSDVVELPLPPIYSGKHACGRCV